MRLGGPIFKKFHTPDEWVSAVKGMGYKAVYFPFDAKADKAKINEYAEAARTNDLVIAEVGAWSNPLSRDEKIANEAREHCKRQLALADELGANCCVNIAGSVGEIWDGHHPENMSKSVFDLIVETVRDIIDSVKPTRTYYTLESMPWMYPDSADSYLALIHAIDREHFAAHYDPVNIINNPRDYYNNGALLTEFFDKLGPYIKSCHAKDIILENQLTVHLNEVPVGLGNLDYKTYLSCLAKLPKDTTIMLEHLKTQEETDLAVSNIRKYAIEIGIYL